MIERLIMTAAVLAICGIVTIKFTPIGDDEPTWVQLAVLLVTILSLASLPILILIKVWT